MYTVECRYSQLSLLLLICVAAIPDASTTRNFSWSSTHKFLSVSISIETVEILGESSPVRMESLPTELLLRVLSLAALGGDGALLLRVVPLVCRRWRDVARDPRCWALVDVDIGITDGVTDDDLLLIARARAIRNLQIACGLQGMEGSYTELLRPMLASRAVLRNVTMWILPELCEESRVAFARMLWRSRKTIRSVKVFITRHSVADSPSSSDPCPRCGSPGFRLRLLEVLAELPRLESLHLDADVDFQERLYNGELAAMASPCLRRLKLITVFQFMPDSPDREAMADILDDLLRCCADTLEDVELSGWWPLSETTLSLLAACPRLSRLSAYPACLRAAAGPLAAVEELTVDACIDSDRTEDDAIDAEACELVQEALRNCERRTLPLLKTLTVRVDFGYGSYKAFGSDKREECRALVVAFAARRPSVRVTLTQGTMGDNKEIELNAASEEGPQKDESML